MAWEGLIILERKALSPLAAWATTRRKALLVTGARQVGKSFLVSMFAQDTFSSVVSLDLLEDRATRESLAAATSADDLMLRISIAARTPLVPQQTVIIIDEVQECPNILTFVKYLVQNDSYRFILTGSRLGTKLNNIDSLPVGYLTQIRMYPLDFEEFCWANGLSSVAVDMARSCLRTETPLPDFLYTRLSDLYHRYLMVGGMPDAVNTFLETNNIDEVRAIHKNLHALYRSDITKHAPKELRLTLRDIYDLIPSEAASKSRRFRISDIKEVRRFSQVQKHFLWLSHAGVALLVYNVSAPASPLLLNEQHNLFKLFYLDVGMLASSYPKKSYMGLLDGKPSMNMGGVYEAFVAQELKARGFALRYFTSKRLGELDFVVERTGGEVLALEVKSGTGYRTHAALDNALAVSEYAIGQAMVLAETNIERAKSIRYLPIFMAGLLEHEERD